MKRKKRILMFFAYMLIALAVLAVSLGVAELVRYLLSAGALRRTFTAGEVDAIAGISEGVVGAIAAGLVLYQLRVGDELDERQSNTEEADFILEYNRSFIENPDMTAVEQYLECQITGDAPKFINSLSENRQMLVNYLTYLEGLASCVHGGILELKRIDDLFAYRFFLAMNHPEVQSLELIPFATYYRGSFQLYEKWINYRANTGKYNPEDLDVPLFETALFYCDSYETYAKEKFSISCEDHQITMLCEGRKQLTLFWNMEESDAATVEFSGKNGGDFTAKYILLRELRRVTNASRIESGDSRVEKAYQNILFAKEECCREGLYFRQLRQSHKLDSTRLKKIAELIYKTDEYIYPDIFGDEKAAITVLPELLREGTDSMFALKNLFVCEYAGKVVGLILWHEGPLNWCTKPLRKALHNCGYEIPAQLDAVEQEYVSGYEEKTHAETISLLNVCVDPEMRGHEIGKRMLRAFQQEHANAPMELCVLSDNGSAIQLYESCGFRFCGEEQAYPSQKADHFRKLMSR